MTQVRARDRLQGLSLPWLGIEMHDWQMGFSAVRDASSYLAQRLSSLLTVYMWILPWIIITCIATAVGFMDGTFLHIVQSTDDAYKAMPSHLELVMMEKHDLSTL